MEDIYQRIQLTAWAYQLFNLLVLVALVLVILALIKYLRKG